MSQTDIYPNTTEYSNEDAGNNNIMNQETNTSQATNPIKDAHVSEYLNGINTFIGKMKNLQGGGGNPIVVNERAKVAKLFSVLPIETLLNELQNK